MIIRRKHTANFTTIGNALFDDERLAADEVGVLAWLLRQHHDWEVRRPALMRRWDIGPVSTKRIINNWMKYGWCQAKKTRLSNGTFHIIYEIRDEPGRELTTDEIREALSLVSSEADSDDVDGDNRPADTPHGSTHHPPSDQGVVDQGVVGDGVVSKKSLLKTDSIKTEPPNGRAFASVLEKWPVAHVVSPFACEQLHVALTEGLQSDAFNGVGPYLAECEASNRKVCDLATFYREHRWERFQKARASAEIACIKPHTPEFHRWREYRSAIGDHTALLAMDLMVKRGSDITVPSRWPPAIPKSSTDPPKESSAA